MLVGYGFKRKGEVKDDYMIFGMRMELPLNDIKITMEWTVYGIKEVNWVLNVRFEVTVIHPRGVGR